MDQSEFEANACNQHQAREKACKRGTIVFCFASHWLRKWREFCLSITERYKQSKANAAKLPSTLRSNFLRVFEGLGMKSYISMSFPAILGVVQTMPGMKG